MKSHPRKVIAANNRKGIFLVVSAVILTALFGFLAVATDTGWLFHQRCRMQTAADAGALYGAQQIRRGSNTQADVESLSDHGAFKGTADNGFTNGTDGAVVTVDYPPATGTTWGTTGRWRLLFASRSGLSSCRSSASIRPTCAPGRWRVTSAKPRGVSTP